MERSHRGRVRTLGKRVVLNGARGFESPPLLLEIDKHTKISSEEISDGREYSLLFLYVKVVVSCKVVGLYGARRRLTNWQDTLF